MSNQTYTEAQVKAMIAEALATQKNSGKSVSFKQNAGVFTTKKGEEKAFNNIRIEGPFYPASVSYSVGNAILANLEEFRKIVAAGPAALKAPVTALAPAGEPRLAQKS